MKKDIKLSSAKGNYSRQLCKCGHSITFLPSKEYVICSWCGRKVKNNTKGRFILKLGKLLWRR